MAKEIIIGLSIIVLFMVFVGHTSICFKPFSISIPFWHRSVGFLLILGGFWLCDYGEYARGMAEGYRKGSEATFKAIMDLGNKQNEKEDGKEKSN